MKGPSPQSDPRRRGVALVMVLLAVMVAAMLAVPFLAAQTTSSAVAQNIVQHGRAQALAESGIELSVAYMRQHSDWRDAIGAGWWLVDQPLDGGTVSIELRDADDPNAGTLGQAVRITAVARLGAVSHTAHARVTVESTSSVGMPYGLAVAEHVSLQGNARVDALDSRHDLYSPWVPGGDDAVVATNTTTSGDVAFQGSSTIHGDVLVGPGGDPDEVINAPPWHNAITGETGSLTEPLDVPEVHLPANLPSSQGDTSFPNSGSDTLEEGTYRYDNFTVSNNFELHIDGDVTIVTDGRFELRNAGRIFLNEGATLTVYADEFRFRNNSRLNHPYSGASDPTAVTLHQTGSADVQIDNSATVIAHIIAPEAMLNLRNNGRLFGAFQGVAASLRNSARLTQDLALHGGASPGGGSGDGDSHRLRWLPAEP